MPRSKLFLLLLGVLVLGLALPVLAKPRPSDKVKETVTLAAGQPMHVAFTGKLSTCERWNCFLWLQGKGEDKAALLVELQGDGQWVAYATEETGDDDDSAGSDDDDSAGSDDDDSSSDDDDSADHWLALPVLTAAEARAKAKEDAQKKYTIEKQRGKLVEDGKAFVVPSELLPEEDFKVSANGLWGAHIGEEEVGSGSKTGLVQVKR